MRKNKPDIYLFNPTCEYAVANGKPSWQPNRLLQKMEEDLSALPLFLGGPEDVVLIKDLPPAGYAERLGKIGISVPRFFRKEHIITDKSFINIPKNRLLPWGWSPAAHKLLEPLKPSCSAEFLSSPVSTWKAEHREIYSKKFALEILISVLPHLPEHCVIPPGMIPRVCTSRQELEAMITRWGKLMVKAPWSSSGRGLQRITKIPVIPKVWEKLTGIINEQGYAIAEPYLDKVLDMALQFDIKNGKVSYSGISRFMTDEKGQYQGNYLNGWPDNPDREAIEFSETMARLLTPVLSAAIEKSMMSKYYEGNFGIDTLVYRDKQNRLRINPCLEINVRQNMGQLSLKLEKLLVPGKKARYKIYFNKDKNYYSFQKEMSGSYPPVTVNNHIESGFFPLTPFDEDSLFGAYILAG